VRGIAGFQDADRKANGGRVAGGEGKREEEEERRRRKKDHDGEEERVALV